MPETIRFSRHGISGAAASYSVHKGFLSNVADHLSAKVLDYSHGFPVNQQCAITDVHEAKSLLNPKEITLISSALGRCLHYVLRDQSA